MQVEHALSETTETSETSAKWRFRFYRNAEKLLGSLIHEIWGPCYPLCIFHVDNVAGNSIFELPDSGM